MSLRDLCDVAYVLRREQAQRDLVAAGGGDLGVLRQVLDDELLAEGSTPAGSGTERGQLLQATLADLGVL